MEKFFDKESLMDVTYTLHKEAKILNEDAKIRIRRINENGKNKGEKKYGRKVGNGDLAHTIHCVEPRKVGERKYGERQDQKRK